AHAAQLADLGQEVVEAELARAKVLFDLGGLLLVDAALGLLDQGHHVAHAENSRRHALGEEDLEVLRLLAGAGEAYALAGGDPKRERGAAAGIAIELGEDHALEADLAAEGLSDLDGLLAGHRVGH